MGMSHRDTELMFRKRRVVSDAKARRPFSRVSMGAKLDTTAATDPRFVADENGILRSGPPPEKLDK